MVHPLLLSLHHPCIAQHLSLLALYPAPSFSRASLHPPFTLLSTSFSPFLLPIAHSCLGLGSDRAFPLVFPTLISRLPLRPFPLIVLPMGTRLPLDSPSSLLRRCPFVPRSPSPVPVPLPLPPPPYLRTLSIQSLLHTPRHCLSIFAFSLTFPSLSYIPHLYLLLLRPPFVVHFLPYLPAHADCYHPRGGEHVLRVCRWAVRARII
ncbi:hypothetical protein C8R47DRAFT_601755 [Mycena vitilis]|nr:hypothetical protein C8R47DRAFT_601755 [Mycena vitilis]